MRFSLAHKGATYMMVAFAYLAMVSGGGVQPMVALGGLVGLIASWWWEPPTIRFEKWGWMWTVASVFALVYSVLTAVVTGDFLGVGAQFLIWLVVAKAFNRRAARDWSQIYLLTFLMLVAGSVLNADLTYGACFLGYVIATTWAITLFHLRREMEDTQFVRHSGEQSRGVNVQRILDSKRIVGGRFFLGTGVLSFGAFVLASIVFLAIPRVGFGFFLKSKQGLTLTGFNDGVRLGGHGVIKNDSTVVMRVEVDPRYGGRDRPEIHWRGVAFDEYSSGHWERTRNAPRTIASNEVPRPGVERHVLSWQAEKTDALASGVKQEIWLDPLDSDVLFGASNPQVFELAQVARKPRPPAMFNDEMRIEHGSTLHYTVWSNVEPPPADALRAAHGNMPLGYERVYLQLPPEITDETRRLAHDITAPYDNNYDKASAIERWLESNLTYTLELKEPPRGMDPVHFFLFERKKGHCEYFASAFAVLARAAGIPTRQVNGFMGGEWNEYQGYVAVRAGDAHSWDEVFFPGVGWVTFDATPAAPGGELGRGGNGWRARMGRFVDTMRFQWTKWVIEYDLVAQLSLFKDIGGAMKSAAISLRDIMSKVLRLWPVVAAIALLVSLVIGLRKRRGREMNSGGGARTRARTRARIAAIYDGVAKQLAKTGTTREASVTPRELAARLRATSAPASAELTELTDLYYAALWGGRSDPAAERRAEELATAIRQALVPSAKVARRSAL